MNQAASSQDEAANVRLIAAEPFLPEDVKLEFADGLNVIYTGHEFILSFMQIQYPLVSRPPTEEEIREMAPVKQKCIARVVVPATRMEEFVGVLQQNLEKARRRRTEQK
jgi:hypothetical protein